jgi:hypothetical protein
VIGLRAGKVVLPGEIHCVSLDKLAVNVVG